MRFTLFVASFFLTFASLASPQVLLAPEAIMLERESVEEAAKLLSEASVAYAVYGKCGFRSRCKRSLKKFTKAYGRIINNNEMESAEQAQQALGIIMTLASEKNQQSELESVRDILSDPEAFKPFGDFLTKAINKRKYRFWQQGLLVLAGIAVVAIPFGVGFYIGGIMFYGMTWEILVAGLVVGGAAGTTGYYTVAKPINKNYYETRMNKQLLKDLDKSMQEEIESYLLDVENSPAIPFD